MVSTTIFASCTPRPDILNGTMSEAEFAARLGPVLSGVGPRDYVDARRFFANTYPTAGLKELLGQVLGRLSGHGSSSAVFRLDTSFGGGKTHGLIALIHGAREGSSVPNMGEFVTLPSLPVGTSVAAFDGEASDPSNGRTMGDGIRAFTPWGEIAYQIGGATGYEIVRKSDEMRRAPGADTLAEVFGDRTVLVVLDELGEYLRKAQLASAKAQADMDGPTAFYVLAWDAFRAVSFPYDEALRLARAVGVDLEEQVIGRLAEKKAAEIKLWDSATRVAKGAVGPADGSRGMIDALHHAAHVMRTRGAEAAQEMLEQAGVAKEDEFKVAMEALLEVLPPSKTFSGIDAEKAVKPAADDFDALEKLRRIAYDGEIGEPQQLELYRELMAAE